MYWGGMNRGQFTIALVAAQSMAVPMLVPPRDPYNGVYCYRLFSMPNEKCSMLNEFFTYERGPKAGFQTGGASGTAS